MSRSRFCRDDQITDNQDGKVDPRYLAEVERMTLKRSALYVRRKAALAAVSKAETRVDELKAAKASRRDIRLAWEAVRAREKELRTIENLMHAPGASTAHRGTRSIWPASDPDGVRREPDAPRERVSDGRQHHVTVRKPNE